MNPNGYGQTQWQQQLQQQQQMQFRNMFSDTELLYTNNFVDDKIEDVPEEKVLDFRRYFQQKMKIEDESLKIQTYQDQRRRLAAARVNDQSSIDQGLGPVSRNNGSSSNSGSGFGASNYNFSGNTVVSEKSYTVCIDSRDRDSVAYPNANNFKVFLGRTFLNVKRIELISTEIPNVDAAIGTNNNKLYWINKEDADIGFPVYSISIKTGSYLNTDNLQNEILDKLNSISVKRRDGTGSPHYFVVTINVNTDYVSFTSLTTTQLGNNPLTTATGSGVITVSQPSHGYSVGDTVWLLGVRGTLSGIPSSMLNTSFTVKNVLSTDSFTVEVSLFASDTTQGGGPNVSTGKEAPFKFLFGEYKDTLANNIGFRLEDSSVDINVTDPLTSTTKTITLVAAGDPTQITAPNHGLQVGDKIRFYNLVTLPPITDSNGGVYSVVAVADPNTFYIDFSSLFIYDFSRAYFGTQIISCHFPSHGFNRITDIENGGSNTVNVTTLFDHGYATGASVVISHSNSVPSIDGSYTVTSVSADVFSITLSGGITTPGYSGILSVDYDFYLYGVSPFDTFGSSDLNGVKFTVRDVVDQNYFTFNTIGSTYAETTMSAGGSSVRISSKIHGFSGTQDNSPNGVLNKSISLAGENYCFLTSPTLDTLVNTGSVKNIFAKIQLSNNPGIICFNSFLSEPKVFSDGLLPRLDELLFTMKTPLDELLDFNSTDFSFTLRITEEVTNDSNNNTSGRMGNAQVNANVNNSNSLNSNLNSAINSNIAALSHTRP